MAKRLSGRQVLNLIFDDESNPENSESSDEENWSSSSEYQVKSDGSDQQEESEEGDDVDMADSEASESDDDILYSLADRPHPDMGHDTEEDRCAISDSFISKSLLEKWSSCAPTACQARAQNVVKEKHGPTSFAKQRVSDENSVVDCFLVFFSSQMWDHIVECTNKEEQRVKQEVWTLTNRKELKAFVGLLLLQVCTKQAASQRKNYGVQMVDRIFLQPLALTG